MTWPDGRKYDGFWNEGKKHGVGIFVNAENKYFLGKYNKGKKSGDWIGEAPFTQEQQQYFEKKSEDYQRRF